MLYAIVSDLHANASAFRAVLDDARRAGAERIVCLGDVVGYGPLPAETVALVRRHVALTLAGNHDDAVSGRGNAAAFADLAADAVRRHREALSRDDLAWLGSLPYVASLDGGAVAAHGDVADPQKFYYVEEPSDAQANFLATDAQLVFVGHTHVPGLFLVGASGTVYRTGMRDFTLEDGKRYIVNPGSVGYPREENGTCRSTYVLYDSTARTVVFRSLPFSVASVMQRGRPMRRVLRRLLLALAALAVPALAATAVLAWRFATRPAPAPVLAADPDRDLVFDTKVVMLDAADEAVRANLKVAPGSAPVDVEVVFRGSDGRRRGGTFRETVATKSYAKRIRIPPEAVRAEFILRSCRGAARPAVTAFTPAAAPRKRQ